MSEPESEKNKKNGIPPIVGKSAAIISGVLLGTKAGDVIAATIEENVDVGENADLLELTSEFGMAALTGVAAWKLSQKNPNEAVITAAQCLTAFGAMMLSEKHHEKDNPSEDNQDNLYPLDDAPDVDNAGSEDFGCFSEPLSSGGEEEVYNFSSNIFDGGSTSDFFNYSSADENQDSYNGSINNTDNQNEYIHGGGGGAKTKSQGSSSEGIDDEKWIKEYYGHKTEHDSFDTLES